ncbi:TniQ family protein (plasmid) [Streptomyces sp. BI20]|uniref:TniQ family protein n=1 Tax=Streptomyces sp. BI20 TaxID=3403460 RepID=UPI003C7293DB
MTAVPLPRSLDPSPGEILPGYLLRLAHRLGISPFTLIDRCGLATGANRSGLSTRHLVRLDDDHAAHLATTCGLTLSETHTLTLAGQFPGYGPLAKTHLGRTLNHAGLANDGWVFTALTRYCPQCLATPDGPIWQAAWRLPHTFLCPHHDRLLDLHCPACRAPAQSTGLRGDGRRRNNGRLVPFPLVRLHPAACRNRPGPNHSNPHCGHRLDHAETSARPTAAMHTTHYLLATAARTHPGTPQAAPSPPERDLFADLRLTALLITGTWPHLAPHCETDTERAAITRHVTTHRSRNTTTPWHHRSSHAAPLPADEAAATLTLAHHLLMPDQAPVLADTVDYLSPTWDGWDRLRRYAPHCSPTLADIVLARAQNHARPAGRRPLFPQAATHSDRLDARHIPQWLPEAWAEPLLALDGPTVALHRDAAVRLVQMTTPLTYQAATRHLGLPHNAIHSAATAVRTWLRTPIHHTCHREALARIADLIAAQEAPVDYHHRRTCMADHTLTDQDWQRLRALITRAHPRARPPGRTAVTAFIWAVVTSSEIRWAPVLSTSPDLGTRARERAEALSFVRPGARRRAPLRAVLTEYALTIVSGLHDVQSPPAEGGRGGTPDSRR